MNEQEKLIEEYPKTSHILANDWYVKTFQQLN